MLAPVSVGGFCCFVFQFLAVFHCIFIFLMMDIWIVRSLCLFWLKLLWTWLYDLKVSFNKLLGKKEKTKLPKSGFRMERGKSTQLIQQKSKRFLGNIYVSQLCVEKIDNVSKMDKLPKLTQEERKSDWPIIIKGIGWVIKDLSTKRKAKV